MSPAQDQTVQLYRLADALEAQAAEVRRIASKGEQPESDYPEHEKLKAVQSQSQAIGEFIKSSAYVLAEWREPAYVVVNPYLVPVDGPIQAILARHFGIDQALLESEKRAMLDALGAS
jgi:hypothetical protein